MRLVVEYPFEYESLLDEAGLRQQAEACLEFHLVRRPQRETRLRLPQDQTISSLTPLDLLDVYWRAVNSDDDETEELQKLAADSDPGAARWRHKERGRGLNLALHMITYPH